jgi:hypothetical protein
MRRIATVLISGILLAIWLAVAPAQATVSSGVTITSTVNLNTDPATGTWTATGAVNDAGTLVEPRLHLGGDGTLQITRVNSGSNGTFTLRILTKVSGVEPSGDVDFTGSWVVISGTGQYATMHGHGDRTAVYHPDTNTVTETLTGQVHFD